jgi:alpha-galactosidase
MNDEEKQQCTTCFADYKQLRPIIQTGDLYRLISPYEHLGMSSLMYTSPDAAQAVLFVYKLETYIDQSLPRLRLAGLNPEKTYTFTEKNIRVKQRPCSLNGKSFTGRFLMDVGIEVPLREDYASRVFELK